MVAHHLVERHLVRAVARGAPLAALIADRAHGVALDAGDLHETRDRMQVVRDCVLPISAAFSTWPFEPPSAAESPAAAIEQATPTSPWQPFPRPDRGVALVQQSDRAGRQQERARRLVARSSYQLRVVMQHGWNYAALLVGRCGDDLSAAHFPRDAATPGLTHSIGSTGRAAPGIERALSAARARQLEIPGHARRGDRAARNPASRSKCARAAHRSRVRAQRALVDAPSVRRAKPALSPLHQRSRHSRRATAGRPPCPRRSRARPRPRAARRRRPIEYISSVRRRRHSHRRREAPCRWSVRQHLSGGTAGSSARRSDFGRPSRRRRTAFHGLRARVGSMTAGSIPEGSLPSRPSSTARSVQWPRPVSASEP